MRLFTALDISDATRESLRHFVSGLRLIAPEAKFVRVESLHVTLKFLGDVEAERCPGLRAALAAIESRAFAFSVAGAGFFPNTTRPKVFWAGIEAPAELAELAHAIDAGCAAIGFPAQDEERPYTPHLTLARAGSGNPRQHAARGDAPLQRIAQHLAQHPQTRPVPIFGKMVATAFHLYESKLQSGGSIYSKVASFRLTPRLWS